MLSVNEVPSLLFEHFEPGDRHFRKHHSKNNVYFARCTDPKYGDMRTASLKIGYSTKPASRCKEMSARGAHYRLLLVLVGGCEDAEQALHKLLKRESVRGAATAGEHFRGFLSEHVLATLCLGAP
jgi:hypothetical protein